MFRFRVWGLGILGVFCSKAFFFYQSVFHPIQAAGGRRAKCRSKDFAGRLVALEVSALGVGLTQTTTKHLGFYLKYRPCSVIAQGIWGHNLLYQFLVLKGRGDP